jgi:hypothetical protein
MLKTLGWILRQNLEPTELESIVHKAVWSLFAHAKRDNRQDKCFNVVNYFMVIKSFGRDTKTADDLYAHVQCHAIDLPNRTVQLTEIRARMNTDLNVLFIEVVLLSTPTNYDL